MSWGWDPAAAGSRAGLESRAVRGESYLLACRAEEICTTIGLPFSSLRGTIIKSNSVSTTSVGNREEWRQENVKRQHGVHHRAKSAPNSGSRQGLAPCSQAFCWWCWPLWREIRHGRPCTMCCSDFLAAAALCWAQPCAALLCSIPGAKTFCPRSSS